MTAGAVLIAVLLGGLILVATRSTSSPITVRHVKSIQTAEGSRTTFEISNHTASTYVVLPLEVEAHDGETGEGVFSLSNDSPARQRLPKMK